MLRGYKIQYKRIGGISDYKEVNVDKSKLSIRLTNLKVFEPYKVKIAAYNDQGPGTWTPAYEWRTGETSKHIEYILILNKTAAKHSSMEHIESIL